MKIPKYIENALNKLGYFLTFVGGVFFGEVITEEDYYKTCNHQQKVDEDERK